MGTSSSKLTPPSQPQIASVYGDQGEGVLLCVAQCSSRVAGASGPTVVSVASTNIDAFNPVTGERRMRLPAPRGALLTAAAYADESLLGPIVAVGNVLGEVHLVCAATLTVVRILTTSGDVPLAAPTRSRLESMGIDALTVGRASPPSSPPSVHTSAGSTSRVAVSCITWLDAKTLLVGHADGWVRGYSIGSGDLVLTCAPPVGGGGGGGGGNVDQNMSAHVRALAVCAGNNGARVVAVGRTSGAVSLHDASSGVLAVTLPTPTGLTHIVSLDSLRCLAVFTSGRNELVLLDLAGARSVTLDFNAELGSVSRAFAHLSAACWDDTRGVLLCGGDDGAVYVRAISRIRGTGDLSVRLVRVAAPAVGAFAPAAIRTLYSLPRADSLITGDDSGLVRRLRAVTGGLAARAETENEKQAKADTRKVMSPADAIAAAMAATAVAMEVVRRAAAEEAVLEARIADMAVVEMNSQKARDVTIEAAAQALRVDEEARAVAAVEEAARVAAIREAAVLEAKAKEATELVEKEAKETLIKNIKLAEAEATALKLAKAAAIAADIETAKTKAAEMAAIEAKMAVQKQKAIEEEEMRVKVEAAEVLRLAAEEQQRVIAIKETQEAEEKAVINAVAANVLHLAEEQHLAAETEAEVVKIVRVADVETVTSTSEVELEKPVNADERNDEKDHSVPPTLPTEDDMD